MSRGFCPGDSVQHTRSASCHLHERFSKSHSSKIPSPPEKEGRKDEGVGPCLFGGLYIRTERPMFSHSAALLTAKRQRGNCSRGSSGRGAVRQRRTRALKRSRISSRCRASVTDTYNVVVITLNFSPLANGADASISYR